MFLQKIKKDSNGQALVEFALVLPILLVVVFGIIQFGIIFNAYISVSHAVRDGVRMAVVLNNDDAVIDRVFEAAQTTGFLNLEKSDITVDPKPDPYVSSSPYRNVGSSVTVTISGASVDIIVPLIPGGSIPISTSATMRVEQGLSAGVPFIDPDYVELSSMQIDEVTTGTYNKSLKITYYLDNSVAESAISSTTARVEGYPDGWSKQALDPDGSNVLYIQDFFANNGGAEKDKDYTIIIDHISFLGAYVLLHSSNNFVFNYSATGEISNVFIIE